MLTRRAVQEPFAHADCYYDGIPPEGFFKEFEEIPHIEPHRKATTWRESMNLLPKRNQTLRWGVIEGKEDLKDVDDIRFAFQV